MSNNFSSIGFEVTGPDELTALAESAARECAPIPTHIGGAYLHYTTDDGSELWIQASPDGDLFGCQPHFAGSSRYRVTVQHTMDDERSPLDGQLVCALVENQPGVPLVVSIPDYRQHASRLETPTEAILQITAMAQEVHAFDDVASYEESPFGRMSHEGALIPSGMFKPGGERIDPPLPHAVLSGRIRAARIVQNAHSGASFHVLSVSTLGGTIDIVASPDQLSTDPVADGVVFGGFFMSARVVDPPAVG